MFPQYFLSLCFSIVLIGRAVTKDKYVNSRLAFDDCECVAVDKKIACRKT